MDLSAEYRTSLLTAIQPQSESDRKAVESDEEQVRNNRYFTSSKVFREEIHRFFSVKLAAIAGTLVGRINDNIQLLKSATSS